MKHTPSRTLAVAGFAAIAAITLSACEDMSPSESRQVEHKAQDFEAYLPTNNVELDNYNRAQELYDDPAAIQWCTAFPSSNSAPIITLPIAGKLTTSATSYFNPQERVSGSNGAVSLPTRSVDGLYHGDSFYRYGFTPGGQYVDFSNSLELLCTTALTEFQRENTFVEGVDTSGDIEKLQRQAEEALKDGDRDKAVDILGGN